MGARRRAAVPLAVLAVLAGTALPATTSPAAAEPPPGGETTPPKIAIGIADSPWEGWYGAAVPVVISATDASGLEGLSYRLTGAQTGEGFSDAEPLSTSIAAEGVTTIEVSATDVHGNNATRTYGVGVDLTDPSLDVGGTLVDGSELIVGDSRTVQFGCADAPTGLASCTATNDGEPFVSGAAVDTTWVGDHRVVVTAVDRTGRTRQRTLLYRVDQKPLTILSNPVLEGSPAVARVNQQLRVGGAVFQPTPGYFMYEWLIDGIHVADGPTFTPQSSQLGKRVSVRAFGSLAGPDFRETRTPAVGNLLIESGPLQVTAQPTIEGNPTGVFPGEELRATGAGFHPAATTVSYRWYADDELVGTGATYTAQAADVGRRLAVQALGQRAGHQETLSSRVGSVPVIAHQFLVERAPQVNGTPQVGHELLITGAQVTPAATSVRNYWTVGATVIETDAPRLVLTSAHGGKRLSCHQVFSAPGYADLRTPCVFAGGATSVSIAAGPVTTWRLVGRAGLAGKAKVGALLRAVRPRTSAPAQRWSYQWLRNGTVIRGATAATYRVRRGDRGDRIAVRVKAFAPKRPVLTSISKVKRVRR